LIPVIGIAPVAFDLHKKFTFLYENSIQSCLMKIKLPAVCGSSFSKARSCCFGLFLSALELNYGMKRIKRIFQILQEERELYGELN